MAHFWQHLVCSLSPIPLAALSALWQLLDIVSDLETLKYTHGLICGVFSRAPSHQ